MPGDGKPRSAPQWSWARTAALVALGLLAFVGLCYLITGGSIEVHAEGGPIELGQIGFWGAAAAIGVVTALRQPIRTDRLNAVWIAALAALGCARELDLHERLNAAAFGPLGVSFKIEWWLDPNVSAALKIGWATAGLATAALVLLPPLLVRAPAARLLRAGDAASWLFIAALALYAMGYAMDDLLGRGRLLSEEPGQAIEEVCELLGAASFCASAAVTLRRPLSERVRALPAAPSPA